MQPRRALPARTGKADGRSRILRRLAERLWLRRHVERGIWTGHAGTGTRRFRRALVCQRAIGAGDVSDLYLRHGRAEKHLAPRDAGRRKAWLLRIDRTGLRIESGRHADAGKEGWQRVCPERRKDVDHLRHHRRRGSDLGQGQFRKKRGRRSGSDTRIPGRNRPSWIYGQRHSREMVAARFGDFGPVAAGCANPRVESVAGNRRIEVSADVPQSGALWNRVGCSGRRDGVLRLRATVFVAAETIPRSAHRLASTGAGETRLDDQRDHEGTVARAASWPVERRRKSAASAHLDGEEKQRLDGAGVCAAVARYSGSEWRGRRLSHHAPSDESGKRKDL